MLVYFDSLSKLTMSGPPTPAAPPSSLPGGDGPNQLHSAPPAAIRQPVRSPSLPESHRTIPILPGASFFRKMLAFAGPRSEEHTSELQSRSDLVCRLLLE